MATARSASIIRMREIDFIIRQSLPPTKDLMVEKYEEVYRRGKEI